MAPPDYNRFLNAVSQRRTPSVHAMAGLLRRPGMVNLAGGLPNARAFPIRTLSMTLADGTVLELSPAETALALQYTETEGLPDLVQWCRKHTALRHNRSHPALPAHWKRDNLTIEHDVNGHHHEESELPAEPSKAAEAQTNHVDPMLWDVCVTTGGQDALVRTFEAILKEGDSILVDEYTYAAALYALRALAPRLHAVPVDSQGMRVDALRDMLSTWDTAKQGPFPKLLYCIPTGHNPLGFTLPLEHRQAIYELACQHDFLILEDDPYYYLSYGPEGTSDDAPLMLPPPSFFEMDREGRVMRYDSFSKILSSGMRLGWVSGPKALVDRVNYHIQVSALQPSGVAQAVLIRLLREWDLAGFEQHLIGVQRLYRSQRDICLKAARQHLPASHACYTSPTAGMFLWVELLPQNEHHMINTRDIFNTLIRDHQVAIMPGDMYAADGRPSKFIRVAFPQLTEQLFDKGFQRLRQTLDEQAAAAAAKSKEH